MGDANNPYLTAIENLLKNDDASELSNMCQNLGETCPCAGRVATLSTGSDGSLKGLRRNACTTEITGTPLAATPEYDRCLLAATCVHFFPNSSSNIRALCGPHECPVPEYVGYGSFHAAKMKNAASWR